MIIINSKCQVLGNKESQDILQEVIVDTADEYFLSKETNDMKTYYAVILKTTTHANNWAYTITEKEYKRLKALK